MYVYPSRQVFLAVHDGASSVIAAGAAVGSGPASRTEREVRSDECPDSPSSPLSRSDSTQSRRRQTRVWLMVFGGGGVGWWWWWPVLQVSPVLDLHSRSACYFFFTCLLFLILILILQMSCSRSVSLNSHHSPSVCQPQSHPSIRPPLSSVTQPLPGTDQSERVLGCPYIYTYARVCACMYVCMYIYCCTFRKSSSVHSLVFAERVRFLSGSLARSPLMHTMSV